MKVVFKNVTFSYDNKKNILNNINFTIPEGSLVCLLGPSGGGKTTTLSLISGLIKPTSGKIYFDNTDVSHKDALQRKVGMVFQNYALYPHLTIINNIAFPLKMQKVPKEKRYEIAKKLAKLVHIEDALYKKPGNISGGQQQRVAIARALAKKPSVLLLDEPLSNLDARLRIEMRKEIRRIQKETHVTTIFVTHDPDEALHIADYIMVINKGQIQQFGTPEELYDNPNNEFVAKFIGDPIINIIPINALHDKLQNIIPDTILNNANEIGIRPEAISSYDDNVLITLNGEIINQEKYGRERTSQIKFNNEILTTTEIVNVDSTKTKNINFNITKKGFFLFDKLGKTIFNGEIKNV